jgi:hypothetical protein
MNTLRDIAYDTFETFLVEPHGTDEWPMPPAVWTWRNGECAAKVSVYTEDPGFVGAAVQWSVEAMAADIVVLMSPALEPDAPARASLIFGAADRQANMHLIESAVLRLDSEVLDVEQAEDVPLDRSPHVAALLATMKLDPATLDPDMQVLEDVMNLGVEAHRAHMDVGAIHSMAKFFPDSSEVPVDVTLYASEGSDRARVLRERAPEEIDIRVFG